MSGKTRFYTVCLSDIFQVIGSADRDLLQEFGLDVGMEFTALDQESLDQEEAFSEDETEVGWEENSPELDAEQEVVKKLIMSGIPGDLAEEEAYAVQDFLAQYALKSGAARDIEPDELIETEEGDEKVLEYNDTVRTSLTKGVAAEETIAAIQWLDGQNVSTDLLTRVQMLFFGRIPEMDEPTFSDLDIDAYSARFGFLSGAEMAGVADDLYDTLEGGDLPGPLLKVLESLFDYCNRESLDLITVIED